MNAFVSSFQQGAEEEVRLELRHHKNRNFLDIRIYTGFLGGSEKVATGKGLSVDTAHFRDFQRALIVAEKMLQDKSLIP